MTLVAPQSCRCRKRRSSGELTLGVLTLTAYGNVTGLSLTAGCSPEVKLASPAHLPRRDVTAHLSFLLLPAGFELIELGLDGLDRRVELIKLTLCFSFHIKKATRWRRLGVDKTRRRGFRSIQYGEPCSGAQPCRRISASKLPTTIRRISILACMSIFKRSPKASCHSKPRVISAAVSSDMLRPLALALDNSLMQGRRHPNRNHGFRPTRPIGRAAFFDFFIPVLPSCYPVSRYHNQRLDKRPDSGGLCAILVMTHNTPEMDNSA